MGDPLGFHQVLGGRRAKQLPDGSGGAVFVEQLDELTVKNQPDRHDWLFLRVESLTGNCFARQGACKASPAGDDLLP